MVQNDYCMHRDKVYNKFVDMVGEVLDKSVAEAFQEKGWINDPRLNSPSPYINNILTTCLQVGYRQQIICTYVCEAFRLSVSIRLTNIDV